MKMHLQSPEFISGETIPIQYTGDGADQSPPLTWDNVPEQTAEFSLICEDPDAPADEPWVHWVIYKIPGETRELPAGLPAVDRMTTPFKALQGKNSWRSGQVTGYRGPLPPRGHGIHHYHFRLYALRTKLPDEPGLNKSQLIRLMEGHIQETAELIGIYQR